MAWRSNDGTSAVKSLKFFFAIVLINHAVVSASCESSKALVVDAEADGAAPPLPAAALNPEVGQENEAGRLPASSAAETGNGDSRRRAMTSLTYWRPISRRRNSARSKISNQNLNNGDDVARNQEATAAFIDTIICRRPYSKFCIGDDDDGSKLQLSRAQQQRQTNAPSSLPTAEVRGQIFELLDAEAWPVPPPQTPRQLEVRIGPGGRRRTAEGVEASRKRVGAPPKGFVLSRGRRRSAAVDDDFIVANPR